MTENVSNSDNHKAFLDWVEKEHGQEVAERCRLAFLHDEGETDEFTLLEKVIGEMTRSLDTEDVFFGPNNE